MRHTTSIVLITVGVLLCMQAAAAASPPVWVMNIGSYGSGTGQLAGPSGIAFRQDSTFGDRLYVADGHNNRIATFGPDGESPGTLSATLILPSDIDVFGEYAYIADTGHHRIVKRSLGYFGTNTEWGSYGTGETNFNNPTSVAVDPVGQYLYVADFSNNRVVKYTTGGTFVMTIGSAGAQGVAPGTGRLYYPCGVAVDPTNTYIYVSDHNNYVQRFSVDGTPSGYFGGTGSGDGKFDYPEGIACDTTGNIYIADFNNNRVQKFDRDSTFLYTFGTVGTGDGQFWKPFDITIAPDGTLYVADYGNNRVQKWLPTVVTVPGGLHPPTDTNGDSLYDDVNGNGRKDFADVVLYFNQMIWIAANEPVARFDYTGNGRIDFADVVWLFSHL